MVADAFTKSSPAPMFELHYKAMLGVDDKPLCINLQCMHGGRERIKGGLSVIPSLRPRGKLKQMYAVAWKINI